MDKTFLKIVFTTFRYICIITPSATYLYTNLTEIAEKASILTKENDRFTRFLKSQDPVIVDEMVIQIDKNITASIDCTQCGNCCKTLMINISEAEADTLAHHLQESRTYFDNQYVEKGSNGMMIINKMPCHFLDENKCTVYEHRFAGCRECPAMHLPDFTARLFTTFMHYERCLIIFNLIEQLKIALHFPKAESD